MSALQGLEPTTGIAEACRVLGISRATLYRRRKPRTALSRRSSRRVPRRLSEAERAKVLDTLHADEFMDMAPAAIHATLLDRGLYLCSPRTMYRLLHENAEVRERRNQRRHPTYVKPELLATTPNQVWSWDITKLRGPTRGSYYALYVILDIFSRCVVAWTVADSEDALLAERLIGDACEKQGIVPGQLTIHADRGSSMTSRTVAVLLTELGVARSHSRPHVSDDNPFSESQFKTMKYRPEFPDRFGSLEDARAFCRAFFEWYNHKHRHSGIAMLPPALVHYGQADAALARRRTVLADAYLAHPERFPHGTPTPHALHAAVWINPPQGAGLACEGQPGARSADASSHAPGPVALAVGPQAPEAERSELGPTRARLIQGRPWVQEHELEVTP
jgi:putative transposase